MIKSLTMSEKKEVHYGVKIASAMYGIVLYLYTPILIERFSGLTLNKNMKTTISIVIASLLCFWFLPKVIGIPQKANIRENLNSVGFVKPVKLGSHILLGIVLALLSLSGMLVGSILTGEYQFNIDTISLD